MVVRVALLIAAVLTLAWLAVLVRDERMGQEAGGRIFYRPSLSAREFDHELERMRAAEFLNPNPRFSIQRAAYLVLRGQPERAVPIAEAIVRAEPENPEAWVVLYRATRGSDPARAAQALAAIRRLNPLSARSRR